MAEETYTTADLSVAAYLRTCGYAILRTVTSRKSSTVAFEFSMDSSLYDRVLAFYNGDPVAMVQPKAYFDALQAIKALVHNPLN